MERIEQDLLATTWKIFVEQGYARTTIEAVARAGRMSKRTIYDRFDSKERLIEAAIGAAFERWRLNILTPLTTAGSGNSEWIEEFVRGCLRILVAPEASALIGFLITEDEAFSAIRETVAASVRQSARVFSELLMRRTPALSTEIAQDTVLLMLDLLIGYSTRLNALHPQVALEQVTANGPKLAKALRMLVEVQVASCATAQSTTHRNRLEGV